MTKVWYIRRWPTALRATIVITGFTVPSTSLVGFVRLSLQMIPMKARLGEQVNSYPAGANSEQRIDVVKNVTYVCCTLFTARHP